MTGNESEKVWFLELPKKFGAPPKRMSASTLKEIESCPRRYALLRASYPQIWNGFGYPPKPSLKALEGTIIHGSIERIVKALKQVNCPSISDALFVQTMRSLNGYSGVLEKQIEEVLTELIANPRFNSKTNEITNKLKNSLPILREQLQGQISKLNFDNEARIAGFSALDNQCRSLPNGIYSEVELNARELEWYGKVDYLYLSDDGCEIADFKTGERKPEHVFQIKIYNLLWLLDEKRNPNSVPVTRLTLSYKDGDFVVPPLEKNEVASFIDEVKERTNSAKSRILEPIPEARPELDNCSYCPVRQLCSDYWTQDTQNSLEEEKTLRSAAKKKNKIDIEIELEHSIAEHLWYAKTLISGSIAPQTRVLVRFAPTISPLPVEMKSCLRLRLLDVNLLEQKDEELSVMTASINWQSEIFILGNP
jgi:CRISPR/Cas system-associated exonuclease Cas4 (RecB family)